MLNYSKLFSGLIVFLAFYSSQASCQTIAEKKAGLQRSGNGNELDPQTQQLLNKVNTELSLNKIELKKLYDEVMCLHSCQAPPEQFHKLLTRINEIKASIHRLDEQWLEGTAQGCDGDAYALWHQPETTLEQLVIDYGSQDYVYLMTPDISAMKLSINSSLPIPRASWNEMLEFILKQNGVGIRQLNPYLRELYLLSQNRQHLRYITNQRQDLDLFPREERMAFMLTPDPSDVRRIWFFLQKFVNTNTTIVQLVGRDILILGQVGDIQDLLKLFDFIVNHSSEKECKLIALSKVKAEEMAKILGTVFDQLSNITEDAGKAPKKQNSDEFEDTNGLRVIVLSSISQALFLVGTQEEICRAEALIRDLEQQVGGSCEKSIFWYTTKHTNPEELAEVLQRIYTVMSCERVGLALPMMGPGGPLPIPCAPLPPPPPPLPPPPDPTRPPFYANDIAVNPAPITLVPSDDSNPPPKNLQNFIVDPKTGSIVMVIEKEFWPKIQETIRKLDVPKRMVQIEVLLFEKRISDSTEYGLNLLRLGGKASNTDLNSLTFNNVHPVGHHHPAPGNSGILEFAFSHMRGNGIPAYDLVYKFLLTQDDVQINANPSVLTINQTMARVAIVDEFSINTGVYDVGTINGTFTPRESYERAQYGITLEITPTVHMKGEHSFEDDTLNYITVNTNVNFDTVHHDPSSPSRPNVIRRNIHNEVLIPDGQTIILGGLRSSTSQDCREAIPFLGELPYFGKLFSQTVMKDKSTEMFIFITPKIVADPCEDLEQIKCEQLSRRPGDVPDFLWCLDEARKWEREFCFAGTMKILAAYISDGYYQTEVPCEADCMDFVIEGEYDGG